MATPDATYRLHPRWHSLEAIVDASGGDLRLDLGCGYYKPAGFIGLDDLSGLATQLENEDNAPDIVIDLNRQQIPFADGSCAEVRTSHFLEHSNIGHVIAETARVLRDGGGFEITVPYANSAEGMYPGHQLFLTEKWFHENRGFQTKFEIVGERFRPSDDYLRLPKLVRRLLPLDRVRPFLFNACCEMTLVARRRPRRPAP